jgi:pyroglutamyl-peptidase
MAGLCLNLSSQTERCMSILITGFEPNDDGLNASKILIESMREDLPECIAGMRDILHFEVLAANTSTLNESLFQAIATHEPCYCLFTGQAPGRNKITLERLATNLKDLGSPDCVGLQPHGEMIEKAGPAAYWSNLPGQEFLIARLNENGIPAALSNNGGNHLCNQILYHALHYAYVTNENLLCGFMHIPPLPIQAKHQWLGTPFIPLSMAREGLSLVLLDLTAKLNLSASNKNSRDNTAALG